MRITKEDIEFYEKSGCCNTEYKHKCSNKDCDNEMVLYAREDYKPEYHIPIAIKCNKCGKKVWFSLPVN